MLPSAGLLALALVTSRAPKQELQFLLHVPKQYTAAQAWPTIVYLHGKSQSGNDRSLLRRYGLPKRLNKEFRFPFLVIMPQCPAGQRWTDPEAIMECVQKVQSKYRIDPARLYAVGFSMGGRGVFRLADHYPGRFAALVTIAGSSIEKEIIDGGRLKGVPVWAFHGEDDAEVPIEEVRAQVTDYGLRTGPAFLSILTGKGHDITKVMDRNDLYDWLLKWRSNLNSSWPQR
ncbi:phospholipase [bacterium]|nr:MAG: phospholipase [bacterium]